MSLFNSSVGSGKIEKILKKKNSAVFFLGIGGIGMSALAQMLLSLGVRVSGCDRNTESKTVERLKEKGVTVFPESEVPENLGFDMLVYTLAMSAEHPIIKMAAQRRIPTVSRAELLGALMKGYSRRICVAGSHGKSTTTAILDAVLSGGGYNPTTVSGAELPTGSSLRLGERDFFVAEACEYKNSFLLFDPTAAIITRVELDHTDFFSDIGMLRKSFLDFINLCRDFAIVSGECENIGKIKKDIKVPFYTYAEGKDADFVYNIIKRERGKRTFTLDFRGNRIGTFALSTIADYVVGDAAAAVSALYLYGIDTESIRQGLDTFSGVARRLELIGALDGRAVIYDYAHHPTEIRKTVLAVKREYGACTVVFRPHTFTRTAALWNDFAEALSLPEHTVLTDIFPAREEAIDGVTSEALAAEIGKGAVCLKSGEVFGYVREKTAGAVILMGAGDIEDIKYDFLVKNKH